MKALITRKLGMTSIIAEDGAVSAVTLLLAGDNTVTQLKTVDVDGYTAVQIGAEQYKNPSKPTVGHTKKAKITPKIICEFRVDELPEGLGVGAKLSTEAFSIGDNVDVTAINKGKGFAGTIRRHNFHRQRKTHGGKGNTRKPGSIGSMYPQHILKGKKMAGQLGSTRTTVKNLKVALIDNERNVIGVIGAVPGPKKGLVILKEAK
ncbi:MAG: 50S ribosomal protein L3 [Candidatus Saccharimonadales bacterium]